MTVRVELRQDLRGTPGVFSPLHLVNAFELGLKRASQIRYPWRYVFEFPDDFKEAQLRLFLKGWLMEWEKLTAQAADAATIPNPENYIGTLEHGMLLRLAKPFGILYFKEGVLRKHASPR